MLEAEMFVYRFYGMPTRGAEMKVNLGQDARLWDDFLQYSCLTVVLKGPNADDRAVEIWSATDQRRRIRSADQRPQVAFSRHSGGDFPLTGYPATGLDYWRNFDNMQTWGLNHIRFHRSVLRRRPLRQPMS